MDAVVALAELQCLESHGGTPRAAEALRSQARPCPFGHGTYAVTSTTMSSVAEV